MDKHLVDTIKNELIEQRKIKDIPVIVDGEQAMKSRGIDGSKDVLVWGNIQKWLEDHNPLHIDQIVVLLEKEDATPTKTVFKCIAQAAKDRLKAGERSKVLKQKAKEEIFFHMYQIEFFCIDYDEVTIQNIADVGASLFDKKHGDKGYTMKSSSLQKEYSIWKSKDKVEFIDYILNQQLTFDSGVKGRVFEDYQKYSKLLIPEALKGTRR